jgi:hypothetical protein
VRPALGRALQPVDHQRQFGRQSRPAESTSTPSARRSTDTVGLGRLSERMGASDSPPASSLLHVRKLPDPERQFECARSIDQRVGDHPLSSASDGRRAE